MRRRKGFHILFQIHSTQCKWSHVSSAALAVSAKCLPFQRWPCVFQVTFISMPITCAHASSSNFVFLSLRERGTAFPDIFWCTLFLTHYWQYCIPTECPTLSIFQLSTILNGIHALCHWTLCHSISQNLYCFVYIKKSISLRIIPFSLIIPTHHTRRRGFISYFYYILWICPFVSPIIHQKSAIIKVASMISYVCVLAFCYCRHINVNLI